MHRSQVQCLIVTNQTWLWQVVADLWTKLQLSCCSVSENKTTTRSCCDPATTLDRLRVKKARAETAVKLCSLAHASATDMILKLSTVRTVLKTNSADNQIRKQVVQSCIPKLTSFHQTALKQFAPVISHCVPVKSRTWELPNAVNFSGAVNPRRETVGIPLNALLSTPNYFPANPGVTFYKPGHFNSEIDCLSLFTDLSRKQGKTAGKPVLKVSQWSGMIFEKRKSKSHRQKAAGLLTTAKLKARKLDVDNNENSLSLFGSAPECNFKVRGEARIGTDISDESLMRAKRILIRYAARGFVERPQRILISLRSVLTELQFLPGKSEDCSPSVWRRRVCCRNCICRWWPDEKERCERQLCETRWIGTRAARMFVTPSCESVCACLSISHLRSALPDSSRSAQLELFTWDSHKLEHAVKRFVRQQKQVSPVNGPGWWSRHFCQPFPGEGWGVGGYIPKCGQTRTWMLRVFKPTVGPRWPLPQPSTTIFSVPLLAKQPYRHASPISDQNNATFVPNWMFALCASFEGLFCKHLLQNCVHLTTDLNVTHRRFAHLGCLSAFKSHISTVW